MYIYYVLTDALSIHVIQVNLNTVSTCRAQSYLLVRFHEEHSPTNAFYM